jgi:hypothetical protein
MRTGTRRAIVGQTDVMAGYDGGSFQIDFEWKEVVSYWEGDTGMWFAAGWGVSPPSLSVPSAAQWDSVVPAWLRGRRDEVIARLEAHSGHVLEVDEAMYARPPAARFQCSR